MSVTVRKKLIEVALPLEAINEEGSRRKRKAPAGYPTTLHKWWAQRPVAAARAVIFAQMVDDPSAWPDLFPTEKAQEKERRRLFRIIEELVKWENTTNETVLQEARDEIWRSWRRACAENVDHPQARELFDRYRLPAFHDPFAGGGTLPLEAQRLGLEPYASDLNPVAVLINKALVEIPPRFAGRPPINPQARAQKTLLENGWKGAQGLAEDVRYYAKWIRHEAEKRIGHLYPEVEITGEMAAERPDLKPLVGKMLPVVAWIWARTVKSPNPAFAGVDVPLVSTFMLSTKPGKEAYVEPVGQDGDYHFVVKIGQPSDPLRAKGGTKLSRGAFCCVMSGTPIVYRYIDEEANAGRLGTRLMAIVVEGDRGRVYLSPSREHEAIARQITPDWKPEIPARGTWASNAQGRVYGFRTFGDYFTSRQLVALTTLSDLIKEAVERALYDAIGHGLADDPESLRSGGAGAKAYAEAMAVYLSFVLSRVVHYGSSMCTWLSKDAAIARTFTKQGISMTWDYAEGNVFGKSSTGWSKCSDVIAAALTGAPALGAGVAVAGDARVCVMHSNAHYAVSTDPPYYDNVGYADLSDFFYAWLRRSLKSIYPELFTTLATPKVEELVASSYRNDGKNAAEVFFLDGMTEAMRRLVERAHPALPVTVYYYYNYT